MHSNHVNGLKVWLASKGIAHQFHFYGYVVNRTRKCRNNAGKLIDLLNKLIVKKILMQHCNYILNFVLLVLILTLSSNN